MTPEVDLRSDTVTRPTAAMRRAMVDAEVGDDVYGEDPTVRRLEDEVASLLGTEAALFVPSGTMANQIALAAQVRPGDEVIVGQDAHCWRFESGALAALAGAQTAMIAGDGRFTGDGGARGVRARRSTYGWRRRAWSRSRTRTTGRRQASWQLARQLADVIAAARTSSGMTTHLDGARLWNAAIATGAAERSWPPASTP
jgi:threonine aldolase